MDEMNHDFDGLREVLGGENVAFEIPQDELREIDDLRRLAAEMADPEPITYTTAGASQVMEFTVHFRNVVE